MILNKPNNYNSAMMNRKGIFHMAKIIKDIKQEISYREMEIKQHYKPDAYNGGINAKKISDADRKEHIKSMQIELKLAEETFARLKEQRLLKK